MKSVGFRIDYKYFVVTVDGEKIKLKKVDEKNKTTEYEVKQVKKEK